MTRGIASADGASVAGLWLQRAHEEGRPFTGLPPELAPRNDAEAYAAQAVYVAALCQQRATTLAGYKIALTSQAMRDLVGYRNSISGCLLADQLVPSGSVLQCASYGRLAVEFEVAFRFATNLPLEVAAGGLDRAALLPYLAAAHPAIEVVDDAEAKRVFTALGEGGNVTMPLMKTFWTSSFGMLTDKFGVPWMVNVEALLSPTEN